MGVHPYNHLRMCGRAHADMGHDCHLMSGRTYRLYKNVGTLMESHDLPRTGSANWRMLSATPAIL